MFERIIYHIKNFFYFKKKSFNTSVLEIVKSYFDGVNIVDAVDDESSIFIYKENCRGYLHIELYPTVAIITFASAYSSTICEDKYFDLNKIDQFLKTVSELM